MLNLPLQFEQPQATSPGGTVEKGLSSVLGWAVWIVQGLCVLAIIVAGGMMVMSQRRGEGGEHASRLGWIIAGALIVGSAATLAKIVWGK